jgi:hypothetical protein
MGVNNVRGGNPSVGSTPSNTWNWVTAPSLNSIESGQGFLGQGMQGDSVATLQRQLSAAGYPVTVDGKYGPQTEAAVRRFQTDHHLKTDGLAGPQTFGALGSSFQPAKPGSSPMPPLNPPPPPSTPSTPSAPPSVTPAPGGSTTVGKYEQIALQKQGQAFVDKVHQIAGEIGAKPEWLFAVMQNESGMSPSAYNANGGATGLIQFMPSTAKAMGTTTDALKNMSALQQLDYVEKFYAPYKGQLHSGSDLYMATFYPLALSKGNDFVLGSEQSPAWAATVAKANPAFDLNKDGQITKGEFQQYYNQRFPELAS